MIRRSADRVVDRPGAASVVEGWRRSGERVVVCSGVFDLLEVGHVRGLAEARTSGDRLVVLIHGDLAAAHIGGPGRPVVPARDRAALVAALRGVDLVCVVEDAAMDALVREWEPVLHLRCAELRGGEPSGPGAGGPLPDSATPMSGALFARVRQRYAGRS